MSNKSLDLKLLSKTVSGTRFAPHALMPTGKHFDYCYYYYSCSSFTDKHAAVKEHWAWRLVSAAMLSVLDMPCNLPVLENHNCSKGGHAMQRTYKQIIWYLVMCMLQLSSSASLSVLYLKSCLRCMFLQQFHLICCGAVCVCGEGCVQMVTGHSKVVYPFQPQACTPCHLWFSSSAQPGASLIFGS